MPKRLRKWPADALTEDARVDLLAVPRAPSSLGTVPYGFFGPCRVAEWSYIVPMRFEKV